MDNNRSSAPGMPPPFRAEERRTALRLRIVPVGLSLSSFLVVTYVLCVALGAVWPEFGLHKPWLQFFPGFEWLTLRGFVIGLAESIGYGWYAALVFVPLYNFFAPRGG